MGKAIALAPLDMSGAAIDHDFRRHLGHTLGVQLDTVEESERYEALALTCLLYTSPSPRDRQKSRMPSSA